MNPVYLTKARRGDALALDTLFQQLHPRLSSMAAYYARRCAEEADDLRQEAWLGVLEALPTLEMHIGDPEQYLLRYARWRLLDAVRRSLRRIAPLPFEEAGDMMVCEAGDAPVVRAFLTRLTPVQRAIIACLLAGCTWRETGALLDCTSANVAYHVRRIGERYREWDDAL